MPGPGPQPVRTDLGAPPNLERVFDPRHNALNVLRLVLALGVIVWHSFPLTGRDVTWWPARQLLGEVFVDAFFAISGFLIVRSWIRRPRLWPFLRARLLRLLPGFWVCLAVTAFVIAPVAATITSAPLNLADGVHYVTTNALVKMHEYDVGGTPIAVPHPGAWDGSLWTLIWELRCYLGVAALGLVGALRYPRAAVASVFAASLGLVVLADAGVTSNDWVVSGGRFALLFSAGGALYVWRHRVMVRGRYLAIAGAALLASFWLPDYRIVAAPLVAYLAVGGGALLRGRRWEVTNDLSYGTYVYAFPAQQLLATLGLAWLPVPVFALASVAATVPFALASWFAVEKPALRLKGRRRPEAVPAAVVPSPATAAPTSP